MRKGVIASRYSRSVCIDLWLIHTRVNVKYFSRNIVRNRQRVQVPLGAERAVPVATGDPAPCRFPTDTRFPVSLLLLD